MKRSVVAFAVSVFVLAALTPGASACSCAAGGDPRERLEEAGGAFIGRALPRPSPTPSPTPSATSSPSTGRAGGGRIDMRFEVVEDFKVDLGHEVTVRTSEGGGTCGFSATPGETVAMFLYRYQGGWTSSSCDQTAPETLRRIAAPFPAPDGKRPVRFVLGGSMGPVRTFSLDAQGRTLAYAKGPGVTSALDLCPGSRVVAELVRGFVEGKYWTLAVATRDVDTLRLRTQYGFKSFETKNGYDSAHPGPIACLDPDGRTLAVFGVHDNRVGKIVRVNGEDETTLYDGQADAIDFSDDGSKALLASCASLFEIDLRSGRKRTVATIPPETLRVDLSPDGRHAIYSSSSDGRSDGKCHYGHTNDKGHYLLDLRSGRSTRIPLKLFGYLWADARTLVLVTKDGAAHVYELGLNELSSWPGWGTDGVVEGGVLYASDPSGLRAASVRTGPARVLRHFDFDQSFTFVVVPAPPRRPATSVTPAPTTPAPSMPTPTIGPQAQPSVTPASGGVASGLAVFATGVALAALAVILKRRRPSGR